MTIAVAHTTGSSSSLSLTIPSTTAGNTLVVCVMSYSLSAQGSVTGITLGGSAGNFSQLCAAHGTGSGLFMDTFIWADTNCAGGQTAIVVSGSNLTIASGGLVVVYEVSGLGTAVLDVFSVGGSSGTSTTWSSGTTGTTATASEFWVGAVIDGNTITKPGAPWTASGVGISTDDSEYQITSSTGTATFNGTTATAQPWAAAVATIKTQPNTTTTGAMTLRPSMSATALGGNTTTTGAMTLKPSMQGTDIETFTSTGAMTLRPSMSGTVAQGFPFPQQPLALKIELLINGTWTDISSYVYQRADITIQRGKPNETTGMTPSQMTLTLNNRLGQFTPSNTSGAFYPFIGRNTQIRVSTQTSPVFSALAYRFWGEVSEWPPQWDETGNDVYVQITAAGWLRRLQQGAKLGSPLATYMTQLSGAQAPLAYWPCTDPNGSSQFASALPGGSAMTWTGTPQLASDTAFGGSDPIPQISGSAWTGVAGAFSSGTQTFATPGTYTWPAPGGITSITSAEAWGAGAGGANAPGAFGGDGAGGGEYAKATSVAVTPGNNYTVAVGAGGAQSADGGNSTFTGDSVTVTAHGGKASGAGGTGSTNATHFDGGAGGSGSNTHLGGGGGGSSAGTAAAGNAGANSPGVETGGAGGSAPTGGGAGGAGGSGSSSGSSGGTPGGGGGGASWGGINGGNGGAGQVVLTYTPSSTPFANVLRFLLDIPSTGGVNGAIYGRIVTSGTLAHVDVVYGTGGTLQLIGYNIGGTALFTSTAAGSYNGVPVIVSVELTPSGANVAWALKTILPGTGMTATTLASGTVSGSVGGVNNVLVNPGGTETGAVGMGQYIVQGVVSSLPDLATAVSGYDGERAADRFTRLSTNAGIGNTLVGNSTDTPQMGPQTDDTLVNLLQGIEDFDHGQMFEARGFFGLTYRTRKNMQNQSPAVTYNYTSGELAQPLQPTADDQMTRNDVTVSRSGGSSARQYLASGAMSIQSPPNGVGEYTYSLTAVAHADSQLSNCALWIMEVGTVAGNRYPVVNIDLSRTAAQANFAATAALDIGDFCEITNPPTFAESATVKELAFGFTETLNAFKRTISVNAVPEIPYEGGGLPTW